MKMKHVDHSGKIDLSDWIMPVNDIFEVPLEKMEKEIQKQIETILTEIMEHGDLSFPIEWNRGDTPNDGYKGPAVNDPLLMYLTVPFDIDGHNPVWSFSLETAVQLMLDCGTGWDMDLEDERAIEIATKVRDGLTSLVHRIDVVLARTRENQKS